MKLILDIEVSGGYNATHKGKGVFEFTDSEAPFSFFIQIYKRRFGYEYSIGLLWKPCF